MGDVACFRADPLWEFVGVGAMICCREAGVPGRTFRTIQLCPKDLSLVSAAGCRATQRGTPCST